MIRIRQLPLIIALGGVTFFAVGCGGGPISQALIDHIEEAGFGHLLPDREKDPPADGQNNEPAEEADEPETQNQAPEQQPLVTNDLGLDPLLDDDTPPDDQTNPNDEPAADEPPADDPPANNNPPSDDDPLDLEDDGETETDITDPGDLLEQLKDIEDELTDPDDLNPPADDPFDDFGITPEDVINPENNTGGQDDPPFTRNQPPEQQPLVSNDPPNDPPRSNIQSATNTAIPEPTTGIVALFSVAGLIMRRGRFPRHTDV